MSLIPFQRLWNVTKIENIQNCRFVFKIKNLGIESSQVARRRYSKSTDSSEDDEEEELEENMGLMEDNMAKKKFEKYATSTFKSYEDPRDQNTPVFKLETCQNCRNPEGDLRFDHYKKIYEQQHIRGFPHLQPSKMSSYGNKQSMLLPQHGTQEYENYTQKIKKSVHRPQYMKSNDENE